MGICLDLLDPGGDLTRKAPLYVPEPVIEIEPAEEPVEVELAAE
jgi:hypothetical protein